MGTKGRTWRLGLAWSPWPCIPLRMGSLSLVGRRRWTCSIGLEHEDERGLSQCGACDYATSLELKSLPSFLEKSCCHVEHAACLISGTWNVAAVGPVRHTSVN